MHKIFKSFLLTVASLGLFAAVNTPQVSAADTPTTSDQISPTNITNKSAIWQNWPSIVGNHVKVTSPLTFTRDANQDANGKSAYIATYKFSVDNPKDFPLDVGIDTTFDSPFNDATNSNWKVSSDDDSTNTFSQSGLGNTFGSMPVYNDSGQAKFSYISVNSDFFNRAITNNEKNFTVSVTLLASSASLTTADVAKTTTPGFGPVTRSVRVFYKDINTGEDIQAPKNVGDFADYSSDEYLNLDANVSTATLPVVDQIAPDISGHTFVSSQQTQLLMPVQWDQLDPTKNTVSTTDQSTEKTVSGLQLKVFPGYKNYTKDAVIFWYKTSTPTPTPVPSNGGGSSTVTTTPTTTTSAKNDSWNPTSSNSSTTTSQPAAPNYAAKEGTAVYAVKGIYMYKNANFKKSQRVAKYLKAKRVNRPMFEVTDYARSNGGALRYKVRDVKTHKVGYITANRKFVVNVYYKTMPKNKKITVIAKKGVNSYKNTNLTQKSKHFKKGAHLTVKKIVKHNLTTRYQLSNGHYVTGNKKLVIQGNY